MKLKYLTCDETKKNLVAISKGDNTQKLKL